MSVGENKGTNRFGWISLSAVLHGMGLALIMWGAYDRLKDFSIDLGKSGDVQISADNSKQQIIDTPVVADIKTAQPEPVASIAVKAPAKAAPQATLIPKQTKSLPQKLKTSAPETQMQAQSPIQDDAGDMAAIQESSGEQKDEAVAVPAPIQVQEADKKESAKEKDPALTENAKKSEEEMQAKAPEVKPTEAEKQVEAVAAVAPVNEAAKAQETTPANTTIQATAQKAEDDKAVAAALAGKSLPENAEVKEVQQLRASPTNPMPKYPESDRVARTQGQTVIVGMVRKDGSVGDIYLEKSSGSKSLDRASLETFRKWKFESGQEGFVRKPFEFRLKGDASASHGGRLRR